MSYPAWHTSRDKVEHYRRRLPEETALYRLVYHYRDEFEYSWDERFAERYGFLRKEVLEALDRYLNCGILRHGCALACCAQCNHTALIAFSCKRRGVCPSCQAKRAVLFAENLEQVLITQPHRHLVFTIPKRLRVYFRYDRSLFSQLYRAAWETWKEYAQALMPGGESGAVMALHTAGSLLNWHPHIHMIALDGALFDDGAFRQLELVDTELLQEFFSEKVFAFLLKAELIDEAVVDSMRRWEHSGFHLHAGEPIGAGDTDARLFLARYLKKAPVSLERLRIDESGSEPVVIYSKPDESGEEQIRSFSALEFLAELSVHIPMVFEQTTRWFGVYSPRSRGAERRKQRFQQFVQSNFAQVESALPERRPSQSWARCMKLVFELDPLRCPKCGAEMKIKSFVTAPQEIERLCKYLGLSSWRPPPKLRPLQAALDERWHTGLAD